jgi:hypothetical protein
VLVPDVEVEVAELLAAARQALADQQVLAVLDELVAAARRLADPRLDQVIVELRHAAFAELDRSPGRDRWPVAADDPFPEEGGIPRIGVGDLDAPRLAGALLHHGCLRVDGLLTSAQVQRFRQLIDRAFEARERLAGGAPLEAASPWFVPFEVGQERATGFGADGFVRTVDVPVALRELAGAFADVGVVATVGEYLGERPAMIANKWVLRLSPTGKIGTDYHQDGAFLGAGIRTVNCWIALSDCGPGTGRPAMDLVPRRTPGVLASPPDAAFPWSLTEAAVAEALPGAPVVSPTFSAGDALFFDELLAHRTSVGLDLDERYAIESWFVAPSSYPDRHVPVVL